MFDELNKQRILIAGGTGNVGTFIVRELLERGATVVVPSRSIEALSAFRTFLDREIPRAHLERLETLIGNLADETTPLPAGIGELDAVVASLGQFVPAPSLLTAKTEELDGVIDGYLRAHFVVAKRLLPRLTERRGTYLFINGPLAFEPIKGWAAGLVSTATAAQHMLFRVIAQEVEHNRVRVAEVVNYAFIRARQTQATSPIPGEAIGAYVADLLAERESDIHGQSIHVNSVPALVH